MTGGPAGPLEAGRFRPDLSTWNVIADWSWYQNDFVNTQPFKGLVVANLMMNNWDWKTSNNKIYDHLNPDGSGERRYVVRDLGASFGKSDASGIARLTEAQRLHLRPLGVAQYKSVHP